LQESGPTTQVQLLTVLWIVGVSIAAWIIYAVVSRKRRLNRPRDLGSVSDQWIAEYRAHQPPDRSR
jgi:beta-lactamase regulating signal transducer with metallopeptidase domain